MVVFSVPRKLWLSFCRGNSVFFAFVAAVLILVVLIFVLVLIVLILVLVSVLILILVLVVVLVLLAVLVLIHLYTPNFFTDFPRHPAVVFERLRWGTSLLCLHRTRFIQ